MRYQVFDSRGNRVDKEFNIYYEDPLPTLPFGTYTVKSSVKTKTTLGYLQQR